MLINNMAARWLFKDCNGLGRCGLHLGVEIVVRLVPIGLRDSAGLIPNLDWCGILIAFESHHHWRFGVVEAIADQIADGTPHGDRSSFCIDRNQIMFQVLGWIAHRCLCNPNCPMDKSPSPPVLLRRRKVVIVRWWCVPGSWISRCLPYRSQTIWTWGSMKQLEWLI